MLRKELIIGILTAFAILVSFGTALAEDSNDKTILGTGEFTFDAPETKADVAARNYVYDEAQLALIGTEGGGEIVSTPKALHVASNYGYDKEHLAAVGPEAGNWEFQSADQGTGMSEVIVDKRDVICNEC